MARRRSVDPGGPTENDKLTEERLLAAIRTLMAMADGSLRRDGEMLAADKENYTALRNAVTELERAGLRRAAHSEAVFKLRLRDAVADALERYDRADAAKSPPTKRRQPKIAEYDDRFHHRRDGTPLGDLDADVLTAFDYYSLHAGWEDGPLDDDEVLPWVASTMTVLRGDPDPDVEGNAERRGATEAASWLVAKLLDVPLEPVRKLKGRVDRYHRTGTAPPARGDVGRYFGAPVVPGQGPWRVAMAAINAQDFDTAFIMSRLGTPPLARAATGRPGLEIDLPPDAHVGYSDMVAVPWRMLDVAVDAVGASFGLLEAAIFCARLRRLNQSRAGHETLRRLLHAVTSCSECRFADGLDLLIELWTVLPPWDRSEALRRKIEKAAKASGAQLDWKPEPAGQPTGAPAWRGHRYDLAYDRWAVTTHHDHLPGELEPLLQPADAPDGRLRSSWSPTTGVRAWADSTGRLRARPVRRDSA